MLEEDASVGIVYDAEGYIADDDTFEAGLVVDDPSFQEEIVVPED